MQFGVAGILIGVGSVGGGAVNAAHNLTAGRDRLYFLAVLGSSPVTVPLAAAGFGIFGAYLGTMFGLTEPDRVALDPRRTIFNAFSD